MNILRRSESLREKISDLTGYYIFCKIDDKYRMPGESALNKDVAYSNIFRVLHRSLTQATASAALA